jgi:hypothetical protein
MHNDGYGHEANMFMPWEKTPKAIHLKGCSMTTLSNHASIAALATAMQDSVVSHAVVIEAFKVAYADDSDLAKSAFLELDIARYHLWHSKDATLNWDRAVLLGRTVLAARGKDTKDASMKAGEVRRDAFQHKAWEAAKFNLRNLIDALDLRTTAEKESATKNAATAKATRERKDSEAKERLTNEIAQKVVAGSINVVPHVATIDDVYAIAAAETARLAMMLQTHKAFFETNAPVRSVFMKVIKSLSSLKATAEHK